MSTTPDKICILSPGRCGSLWLQSLLLVHYLDINKVKHTHLLDEALADESNGYTVITLRRQNMLEWVLSYAVLDNIPQMNITEQNTFHVNQPEYTFYFSTDKYSKRRNWLRDQLQTYESHNWSQYNYEDLVADQFAVLSNILDYYIPSGARSKLQYNKKTIVENYDELVNFESNGIF